MYLLILFIVFLAIAVCMIFRVNKENYTKKSSNLRDFIKKNVIPYELKNITYRRYGPKGDGGYIISPELLKYIDVIYCYGVMEEDIASCELAEKLNVMVYQYDCFSENVPFCKNTKNQKFIKECAGKQKIIKDGKYVYNTVENHIKQNNDIGKNILMLMDIEGSEYEVLLNMPTKILKNIVQLQLEVHWFFDDDRGNNNGDNRTFSKRILDEVPNSKYFKKLVKKLLKTHNLAHVHCNNHTCIGAADGPEHTDTGVPCDVIEMLWINKKFSKKTNKKLNLPLSIDQPNQPDWKDCHWQF